VLNKVSSDSITLLRNAYLGQSDNRIVQVVPKMPSEYQCYKPFISLMALSIALNKFNIGILVSSICRRFHS
jgi:hypothetical protein